MLRLTDTFDADEVDSFVERWAKRSVSFPTLAALFPSEWVRERLIAGYDQGPHPVVEQLIDGDGSISNLETLEKVFVLAMPDNEAIILEKVKFLKAYSDYPKMREAYIATLSEIYVLAHLRSKGINCSLRCGAGADIIVRTPTGEIDIEVTTRFTDHIHEEFLSRLKAGTPRSIRENYSISIDGSYANAEEMRENLRYLFHQLQGGLVEEKVVICIGNMTYEFRKSDCPTIGGSCFVSPLSNGLTHDIGLKLDNKAMNKNQTGGQRPVIVVVNVSTIDGSCGVPLNGGYTYPAEKIPSGIDGVVTYWMSLDSIGPWRSYISFHPAHNPLVDVLATVFR